MNPTVFRSTDRVFRLELVDKRKKDTGLFNIKDTLHGIFDPQRNLWYLKYEHGKLPSLFQQNFTSFKTLYNFVEDYFSRRNIRIIEVVD